MLVSWTQLPLPIGPFTDWTPGPSLKPGRHNPLVPDLPLAPPFGLYYPGELPLDGRLALKTRGKIGQSVFQTTLHFLGPNDPNPRKVLQRRRGVMHADPRTFAQLQLRARFGRAVRAWRQLTDEARSAYNARALARAKKLEGLNLWIRDFTIAHAPDEFANDAAYLLTHGSLPPEA